MNSGKGSMGALSRFPFPGSRLLYGANRGSAMPAFFAIRSCASR